MMDVKALMSGMAIVIDDAFRPSSKGVPQHEDPIIKIVRTIEQAWRLPCYRTYQIPEGDEVIENLLYSASFILLDWKLWPNNASELERDGIQENIRFLKKAKGSFVPVFIFTNESPDEIKKRLAECGLYTSDVGNAAHNFIFVEGKNNLEDPIPKIERWLRSNASVYTLKAWDTEFRKAKKSLFASMYSKYPDWPKVFWQSYKNDNVDPSSSVVNMINNNLLGRIGLNILKDSVLGSGGISINKDEIKSLISEASFILNSNLQEDEVRSGDLFKCSGQKYFLNIRPDCDCIPRNEGAADDVDIYCVQGYKMREKEIRGKFLEDNGWFNEKIYESVVFSIYDGKTILFDFRKFSVQKFSKVKTKRVGRLIHPYITRIQQRYALYLQRQGLPRIPKGAVVGEESHSSTKPDGEKEPS